MRKGHVLLPVAKAHAEYIEKFKEELGKAMGEKVTTRYATEVLQEMMPKEIRIEKVIKNNNRHLIKDRNIQIVLSYNVREL